MALGVYERRSGNFP